MSCKDSLGDRMKRYEGNVKPRLCRRLPVIVRVDGRAFHSVTRGMRAFDRRVIDRMVGAAMDTLEEMQGGKLCYVQSDEASFLLTDWEKLETEPWFGYDLQKVVSLAAAEMTVHWNQQPRVTNHLATFDARALNLPHSEVANYFLWRARDWHRNSIQMLAQEHFSPAEMHGKTLPDLLAMLERALSAWTELREQERQGTWLARMPPGGVIQRFAGPTYAEVAAVVEPLLLEAAAG